MLAESWLLLLLLAGAAPRGRGQPSGGGRPTCPQLLPQLPAAVRTCSLRALDMTIAGTVIACGAEKGFNETPLVPDSIETAIATSFSFNDIVHSDTKWTVCKVEQLGDPGESHGYFGAVWNSTEGSWPSTYKVWVATFHVPPCWNYNIEDAEKIETINQETASSFMETETYRCTHCRSDDSNDHSAEDRDSAGQNYTYVIINDGIPTVFRYSPCTESNKNIPVMENLNVTRFTCNDCKEWIYLSSESSLDCETGKKPLGDFNSQRICKQEPYPVTMQQTLWTEGTSITMLEKETTTTLRTEEDTWFATELTSDLTTTQLPTSTKGTYMKPTTKDTYDYEIVYDALEQLKSQNYSDYDVKYPENMLMNLEIVITSSSKLQQNEVSEALHGFEKFSKAILDNVTSARWSETKMEKNFTLVVATGVVGAVFGGQGIKLLTQEEDWKVEKVLAKRPYGAVLLGVEKNGSVAGIAITVLPRNAAAAALKQEGFNLNSDVISVQVSNSSPHINHVDIFLKPQVGGVRRRCGMWNLASNIWEFNRCTLHIRDQATDVCRCEHLTHFAQLVTDADMEWGDHAHPLEVLSLLGMCASLLGALGLAVTAALSSKWRRKAGTRVLLQLAAAVAARDMLMLVVTVDAFRPSWLWRLNDLDACGRLGVALHYATLAAAAWTTTASVLQLLKFNTISGAQAAVPHTVLVSAACSWLPPLVPVAALLAVSGLRAGYPLRQDAATDYLCYPKGAALYYAVVFPVIVYTTINGAIFLYLLLTILFPVHKEQLPQPSEKHGPANLRRRVLTAVMLFFLLGLPWVLGPPARVPAIAYLFCAVATPQGMALFVCFVVCNGQLRSGLRATVRRAASRALRGYWAARRPYSEDSSTRTNVTVSEHASLQLRKRLLSAEGKGGRQLKERLQSW